MSNRVSIFPHPTWNAVSEADWLAEIKEWFRNSYLKDPNTVMEKLLDHIFDIMQHSKRDVFFEKIMELGKQLKKPLDFGTITEHHLKILHLLGLGLHMNHSHLFMLPQINKVNLLKIDGYPTLLLATKELAQGNYEEAYRLANHERTCCLAQYIMGQCERKRGIFFGAQQHFDKSLVLLSQDKSCPFNNEKGTLCNHQLLRAEIFRGQSVVFRMLEDYDKAEEFCNKALQTIETIEKKSKNLSQKESNSNNISFVDSEQWGVCRVNADICHSFGYYWYNQKNYEKAEFLFRKAVVELEKVHEEWDSPYTRLAVILFCKEDYIHAVENFTKAAKICQNTPILKNGETNLSLALCHLGLRILEFIIHQNLGHPNPINDLENALKQKHRLSIGPLKCHRDDAKHFFEIPLPLEAKALVEMFVARIEEEIKNIDDLSGEHVVTIATTNSEGGRKMSTFLELLTASTVPAVVKFLFDGLGKLTDRLNRDELKKIEAVKDEITKLQKQTDVPTIQRVMADLLDSLPSDITIDSQESFKSWIHEQVTREYPDLPSVGYLLYSILRKERDEETNQNRRSALLRMASGLSDDSNQLQNRTITGDVRAEDRRALHERIIIAVDLLVQETL